MHKQLECATKTSVYLEILPGNSVSRIFQKS